MGRERKKRVEVRRLTSFERLICERTLYLILSFILSQWRDFKNSSNVMKFRSFGDSTSSRVKDKLKTIRLSSG